MTENARYRRYITASKGEELRRGGQADWLSEQTARTFNIVTNEWTEWQVIPDHDPRVNMVEDYGTGGVISRSS